MVDTELTVLKGILRKAAECAQEVPESMQASAFSAAVQMLQAPLLESPRHVHASKVKASTALREKEVPQPTQPTKRKVRGPQTAISDLIGTDYFRDKRTGADVSKFLKESRGLNYEGKQVAKSLLRLVQAQKLSREKLADGGYTYQKPS